MLRDVFSWSWWTEQRTLRNLDKWRKSTIEEYRKAVAEDKEAGAAFGEARVSRQFGDIWLEIDNQQREILDGRLKRDALRLGIPLPERPYSESQNQHWEWVHSELFLTDAGKKYLRDEVRKEQRERSEMFFRWTAALTGLIGAITGLVAVSVQ